MNDFDFCCVKNKPDVAFTVHICLLYCLTISTRTCSVLWIICPFNTYCLKMYKENYYMQIEHILQILKWFQIFKIIKCFFTFHNAPCSAMLRRLSKKNIMQEQWTNFSVLKTNLFLKVSFKILGRTRLTLQWVPRFWVTLVHFMYW